MQYIVSFLEGIITFISPCLLPMLPIYLSYFAAGGERTSKKTLLNALGFCIGFSVMFILMGALAGSLGSFLRTHQTVLNLICGLIIILFGLNFLGVFNLNVFRGISSSGPKESLNFFSAVIFGIIFSIGWTPCVGVFLGSALVMASQQASALKGILMLLTYSLGLSIPFIISALLIDKLKTAFDFIKRNYKVINALSGALLIIIGITMMTGHFGKLLTIIS